MPAPTVTKASARPAALAKNTKSPPFKKKAAPNASILNFFKKAPPPEESMFVRGLSDVASSLKEEVVEVEAEVSIDTVAECSVAVKRQKLEGEQSFHAAAETTEAETCTSPRPRKRVQRGPFLDDSDDSDENDENDDESAKASSLPEPDKAAIPEPYDGTNSFEALLEPMVAEESFEGDDDEFWANLDEDDSFEGEEQRERKYMEEQTQIEAAEAKESLSQAVGKDSPVEACPICGLSLAGQTASAATIHVNACLDGPQTAQTAQTAPAPPKKPLSALASRFHSSKPRPGQPNPISLGSSSSSAAPVVSSAFAKLMSSHAEDAAWATAAASEGASSSAKRPRFAARTCPFYKIMPGLAICVDAFRYGAVEGCRAYFLSHFHSDHYVGLTAKWSHGPIYCSHVTASLVRNQLGTAAQWVVGLDWDQPVPVPGTNGVQVTLISANHCPGSAMFLFEKPIPGRSRPQRILHCGDFRACPAHVHHARLRPAAGDVLGGQQRIDVCYLDTTYLNPRYSFPPQDDVVGACARLCAALDRSLRAGQDAEWDKLLRPKGRSSTVGSFFTSTGPTDLTGPTGPSPPRRLLVVCGTYSIGKERICVAIAQALGTKIFAPANKRRVLDQLDDPALAALLTSDATAAQVHMQMLMEMRADTLAAYRETYGAHFARVVGFRPSGWNYRPSMANGAATTAAVAAGANLAPGSVTTTSLLHDAGWRTRFGERDLVPQRGSTREAVCFGVPYSEHSSFRELALFVMALPIDKVVPTVNVGSEQSRRRMKSWLDRWMGERRRGGLVDVMVEEEAGEAKETEEARPLWDGKMGKGGGAYW